MRSGGGKPKGSQWERDVCRSLSLWLSDQERDDLFWRSAMSGGRATIGLRQGMTRTAQAGDISAISAKGELLLNLFVLECKFYKDFEVIQGITKDTGTLYKFWMDLRQYAFRLVKRPILVGRQNYMPPFVLVDSRSLPLLGLCIDHSSAILPRWDCHLILFDAFLREAIVPAANVCIEQDKPPRVRLANA